jgi:5-methylcytosine-specific restriction endonuclease McrA
MKLSKKKREALREKFRGCCAYCGVQLGDRWHADHIKPVRREHKWVKQEAGSYKMVQTGTVERPENDHEDNLHPACTACNIDKHALSLEDWRKRLERLLGVCERNHSAYRHALRFGLVVPNPQAVVFHFEKLTSQSPC